VVCPTDRYAGSYHARSLKKEETEFPIKGLGRGDSYANRGIRGFADEWGEENLGGQVNSQLMVKLRQRTRVRSSREYPALSA